MAGCSVLLGKGLRISSSFFPWPFKETTASLRPLEIQLIFQGQLYMLLQSGPWGHGARADLPAVGSGPAAGPPCPAPQTVPLSAAARTSQSVTQELRSKPAPGVASGRPPRLQERRRGQPASRPPARVLPSPGPCSFPLHATLRPATVSTTQL